MLNADDEAGKEALRYLGRSAEVPGEVARECVELVMKPRRAKDTEIQDGILAGLLRESPAAKAALAKRLQDSTSTTVVFEDVYNLGDGAANGIVSVVLDSSAWSTEVIREACERDVFQLYLAKLMEVGDEHDGRAMKGISRLLAADASRLYALLDEITFNAILSSLDYRNSTEVKSHATLATAKYLEASESSGQTTLMKFVTTKVALQKNEDLVLAFSAAAAVFPIAPSVASALFLVEGFVPSLVPLLEKKAKSAKVEQAALEMLSAACIYSACREAIRNHCTVWLHRVLETGEDQRSSLAAVTLAKIQGPSSQPGTTKSESQEDATVDNLVSRLKQMLVRNADIHKQSSIEGSAYASVQPKVKEKLAEDKVFLTILLQDLSKGNASPPIIFGALTLIDNLTRYLPNLSEEQKRMSQLKAYANASKTPAQHDSLDEEAAVTKRCKTIVDAGTISVLAGISKTLSPTSTSLVFQILLSLSRTPSLRGIIAQQGGAKFLLQNYTHITGTSPNEIQSRRTAAHALSRILISVNPSLIFATSGVLSMTNAIRPIITLLTDDPSLPTEGPRDLLATFEALLALTDLASVTSSDNASIIIRLAQPTIEDLVLNNNSMIQRAATELVNNLVQSPEGVELFADESPAAARRLHILLALADAEDVATRKAAGGALAVLTAFEGAVNAILARERGMNLLLGLCDDEDLEVVHRGVVCVANIASMEGKTGEIAKAELKEMGTLEKLKAIIPETNQREILDCVAHALKALMD